MSYEYGARVVRWVDGDTVYLEVDVGFRLTTTASFRLMGIDTPERGQPGATDARLFAESLAPVGAAVRINTYKDPDKYGRWLVEILPPGADWVHGATINRELVETGRAVPYYPR